MTSFSAQSRLAHIQHFQKEFYDVVIIGGGITGAGIARDAASRGMKVALIEMSDFASGTSSRSSKLIHGGIRYLENLEFHLVYEALSERALLFDLAPHLVHPLRFLLPLYQGGRVGMFKMGLGMWLYDILSLFEAPEMHERLNFEATLIRMPILREKGLLGSYEYSDAYMDDDRLVFETLRSAHSMGAHCANYVKALGSDFREGKIDRLCVRDEISGNQFYIQGQHFVSTVGPWTDQVASQVLTGWKPIMRPSKGIHFTVSRKDLPLNSAVVMASDKDNRIVFAIPRHEMVIIGTTDTDFKDDPKTVHSTRADVGYLLNIVHEYFPGANITENKIIASYAGVRPLVNDGASTESRTSREHTIINDPRNITFVAGGKYTTYRRMAEQAVVSFLNQFSIEQQIQFAQSHTKEALNPLVTSEKYHRCLVHVESLARELQLPSKDMQWLLLRHGEEALQLEKMNFSQLPRRWHFECEHAIQQTMCLNLDDFYLRRVPLFLAEPDHGLSLLEGIADFFAEKLGWKDVQRQEQVQLLKSQINKELAWKNKVSAP